MDDVLLAKLVIESIISNTDSSVDEDTINELSNFDFDNADAVAEFLLDNSDLVEEVKKAKAKSSEDEEESDDEKMARVRAGKKKAESTEEESDEEEDEESDEEDKKKSKKKEAKTEINMSVFETIFSETDMDTAQADAFASALKTAITEAATDIASEQIANVKAEHNEELAKIEEQMVVKYEKFTTEFAAEFYAENESNLVDQAELDHYREAVSAIESVMQNHNLIVDGSKSSIIEETTNELAELRSINETLTTKTHELRNELMLERVEKIASKLASGLTETDQSRFEEMLDDIDFKTVKDFEEKATIIRDKFFETGEQDSEFHKQISETFDSVVVSSDSSTTLAEAIKRVK